MFVFWLFMLTMCLLLPVLLIPIGKSFEKSAPKNVNNYFGYRTAMSMKNDETWTFAHKYWGKKVFVFGLISLPLAVVPMLFVINTSIEFIAYFGLCVMVLISAFMLIPTMVMTEKALKRNFDSNGNKI